MPPAQLTDEEIDHLVTVTKHLPHDYRTRLRMRPRSYSGRHEEGQLEVVVEGTGTFRIILRRNRINPLDFSAILGYIPPERLRLFHLRRYNGLHRHTNRIERASFRAFHIHYATQRYQDAGWDIDAYAETTDEYAGIDSALDVLLDECSFIRPGSERMQPRML